MKAPASATTRSEFRWPLALLVLVAVACPGDGSSGGVTLDEALSADWGALDVQVVTALPEDRMGGTVIVFLHGYGSSGSDYASLAQALLDDETRVILPTAVLPHASGRGRVWWEFIEEDWPRPYWEAPSGSHWPSPSQQLPRAREAILSLLADLRERFRPDSLALAGHSQGAMLALDAAMAADPPPDRVAALAGYVLLDSFPNITRLREVRPRVFISHGRADAVVDFDRAELMRKVLEENGFPVTFDPHQGGHGVAESELEDLRAFLLP